MQKSDSESGIKLAAKTLKKERPPFQKNCLVCGDNASGFNFNVLSCESCKAFFRRHGIKPKEYKCPFSNQCNITVVTRKFCQKCRLKKCQSVGMVKKRTNKTEKRRRMEEKREKQRQSLDYRSSSKDKSETQYKDVVKKESVLHESPNGSKCNLSTDESILNTNVENILYKEKPCCMEESNENKVKIKSQFEQRYEDMYGKRDGQYNRSEQSQMESILSEVIRVEFEAFSSTNTCQQESSRELNEVEKSKLNELIVANKTLHMPIDVDLSQLVGESAYYAGQKSGDVQYDPRILTIVNLTAVAIRRFIKMAKKINAFKSMCEEDQVALLKGGCIELMVLRSTMTYDESSQEWKLPHTQERFSSIHTDVLKCAENLYFKHAAFILSFEERWRLDENVILIMSAILLFTPDRPRVLRHDVIQSEQNSYYYLLRRYLESLYPGCKAKSDFLKLIQIILELRKIAEEVTGIYLNVGPIEPLLMEIIS